MEKEDELNRGPWSAEEDDLLSQYVNWHGEGRWNKVAKHAGLKRTGKSCRMTWMNHLKPGIKRGRLTSEEQLLIFQLHSQWARRWSKIAKHLPGRTDNKVKNFWRTRVRSVAGRLKIDSNSQEIDEAVKSHFMPI